MRYLLVALLVVLAGCGSDKKPKGPDLTVEIWEIPDSVELTEVFSVRWTVTNCGNRVAPATSTMLAAIDEWGFDPRAWIPIDVPSLDAGETYYDFAFISMEEFLYYPAYYWIDLVVDYTERIEETNEENNTDSVRLLVY